MTSPSYFTVIPANVRYDRNLTFFEIVLYGEIVALTNAIGYCFATNDYFMQLFNVSESTIKRSIKKLGILGHLKVVINHLDSHQRKIYLVISSINALGSKMTPPGFKIDTPPGFKIDTHNNTSINNLKDSNTIRTNKSFNQKQKPDINIDWLDDYIRSLQ